MSAAVTLAGVGVRRGRSWFLRDIDLSISAGERVAVLGPNGAGKSTLMGAIAYEVPTTGSVTRNGRVAALLQQGALSRSSVLGNLAQAQAWWGTPTASRRARTSAALDALGIAHLADRSTEALSGGERRRVHLARALVIDPDVLILDEPFAGLDPDTRHRLITDAGAALRGVDGASVVVTHDRDEAVALADRIVVVMDGRIAADGEARTVLDAPPDRAVATFLGYTGELIVPGGVVCVRPHDLVLDAAGAIHGTVTQVIRLESTSRLSVSTDHGVVEVVAGSSDGRPGQQVRLSRRGGVEFAL